MHQYELLSLYEVIVKHLAVLVEGSYTRIGNTKRELSLSATVTSWLCDTLVCAAIKELLSVLHAELLPCNRQLSQRNVAEISCGSCSRGTCKEVTFSAMFSRIYITYAS